MSRSQTKESIIAAARPLFARSGYEGVSMRELASGLGITQAALYYHFRDKDDLYFAVMEDAAEGPVSRLRQAASAAAEPAGALAAVLHQLAAEYDSDPDLCRLVLRSILDEDRSRGRLLSEKVFGSAIDLFGGLAGSVWPEENPLSTSVALIAAATFPYAARDLGENLKGWNPGLLDPDELTRLLVRIFSVRPEGERP